MAELLNPFGTLAEFDRGDGRKGKFYSLPKLEAAGVGKISRLPVSLRLVLESVLRNCDGKRVREEDVRRVAAWKPNEERTTEIPFVVARILLQDFTGVPLLVDLAAMRSAMQRLGGKPAAVEPLVPVELVIDHSVQVDYSAMPDALHRNMVIEFHRNKQRYEFLKWGMQAFKGFGVVPPGVGIVHQVNLEYLARGVFEQDGLYYPDTLVGTDSHTTMINGLGVVAWGVGGIEAEAGMLGQPVYFLAPDVVGMHLTGKLKPGVTATDLVLHVTEILRKHKVVGKFVEFFGEGAAALAVTDRATIANMAPEYGATMGFFPIDEECCKYLLATGRSKEKVDAYRRYYQAQGLWGVPKKGEVDYTSTLELDLGSIEPSASGPRRPQDRLPLTQMKPKFRELLAKPKTENGYGITDAGKRVKVQMGFPGGDGTLDVPITGGGNQASETMPKAVAPLTTPKNTNQETEIEMMQNRPTPDRVTQLAPGQFPKRDVEIGHGDVVIAAITSCTNTSNPSVMLAAGLVAKKAVEKGLSVRSHVKTSLAPGSRVVSEYLDKTGLQKYLDQVGFHTVGYGCTTCIGNSGPLEPHLEEAVQKDGLVVAAVLSGNRNFEARVHQSVKANYLMSPPLVVSYALAGRVDFDPQSEPVGTGKDGKPVYLKDIWPTPEEVAAQLPAAFDVETYRRLYSDLASASPLWGKIPAAQGALYPWDRASTYIQEPPYFENFAREPKPFEPIRAARALAIFGDSVTTDHISPAGNISGSSPAAAYLKSHNVQPIDFNSYGARRGNHEVMVRGTFANVRIKNLMLPGVEGGVTLHQPSGEKLSIFDAAMRYQQEGTPLVIFAGLEYGTGSSRDWAAKGTSLLGVRAVVARSFERIHRSNLIGMGVLPCEFEGETTAQSLGLNGTESYEILGIERGIEPGSRATLRIRRADGKTDDVTLKVRVDTPMEAEYLRHGGILPFMLRQMLAGATA